MSLSATTCIPVSHAFDALAESYDAVFTDSLIGKAQRSAVWECAERVFPRDGKLLELNCGTGEDAAHFADRGLTVTAFDISEAMIQQARRKADVGGVSDRIAFEVRAIEEIGAITREGMFQCAFSNFSGLNCVGDLSRTAEDLAGLLQPGAPLLFCLSTRVCLWEMFWYLARGNFKKAFRRLRGQHETKIGTMALHVYYPTVRQLRQYFSPYFRVVTVHGIGITVPPSYAESWMARQPWLLRLFSAVDSVVRGWPVFRAIGDHMLVHLERTSV